MNPLIPFVLGLLSGWLVKLLIDFFSGRGPFIEKEAASAPQEISGSKASSTGNMQVQMDVQTARDDLKIIKGIGPVIERKLNEAGIYTFQQLGNLTSADLRNFLGKAIERLADEESLLTQARDLARKK